MKARRVGITLIEMIVVVGIICVLLAISIPAIQHVRETARRTSCQSNLRQLAIGTQDHETAFAAIPSLYNGRFLRQPRHALDEFHFHSWRTAILPQIEQGALFDQLDLSLPATDPANQRAINTSVGVFVCPSTATRNRLVPDIAEFKNIPLIGNGTGYLPPRIIGTAARSDYEAIAGVNFPLQPLTPPFRGSGDLRGIKFGPWGEPEYDQTNGTSLSYRKARLRDITDGLSNTILVAERAGRPDWYQRGKPVNPYPYTNTSQGAELHQAAWGISTHIWWLVFHNGHSINASNIHGIYSFHPTGANVALADGSVRFMADATDTNLLNALVTRSSNETLQLE